MFRRSESYRDRPTRFLEVLSHNSWQLKLYSIVYGPGPLGREIYDEGMRLALLQLPQPAEASHRPGVGFVIFHQGRGMHYLVLCWWDNENELFSRVFVREFDEMAHWRSATAGESGCVWDLQVIWHERQAYVESVLAPDSDPDVESYLQRRMEA